MEKISQNYFNSDLFSRDRPEAICQSVQDLIEVEGYFYDRKSPTCCVPWHVKEGDIYTVVGFSPKLEYKLGPHSDAFPETFPAHVSMWMSWANEAEPPVSEYGILWHNQQPSGSLNPFGVSNQLKMATILNKGAIRNYNDIFHDYFIPASILGVIVSYPMASAAFGLLLFTLFALRCYKCLLKRYNMEDQIPMPAAAHKRTNNNSRDVEGGENICPDPDDVLRKVTEKVTSVADSENVRALKVK